MSKFGVALVMTLFIASLYYFFRTPESKTTGLKVAKEESTIPATNTNNGGLTTTFYFEHEQFKLTADHRTLLLETARHMSTQPNVNWILGGHADDYEQPEANLMLGLRRVQSVSSFLIDNGVTSQQLSTVSCGDSNQRVPGHSSKEDRRVGIEVNAQQGYSCR